MRRKILSVTFSRYFCQRKNTSRPCNTWVAQRRCERIEGSEIADVLIALPLQLSHTCRIFISFWFLLNQLARHCSYNSIFKHPSKPFGITIPLSPLRTDFSPPQSMHAVDDNRLCAGNKEPGYRWYHPYHSLRFPCSIAWSDRQKSQGNLKQATLAIGLITGELHGAMCAMMTRRRR